MKLPFGLALLVIAALLATSVTFAADITGAGATFPYPIYAKWADAYKKETGIRLNYQSIGSGGGIKQVKAKTVDFGASDKPLTVEELEKKRPDPVSDRHGRRGSGYQSGWHQGRSDQDNWSGSGRYFPG